MIKRIKIENLKSIESLEKEFAGNIYFVKGENDLGKSTILYIIDALLTGNTKRHELLQHGKEKGQVELETDNFKIKCVFTKNNPNGSIIITDKRTGMCTSKKSALQEIFGYNSFDAEEFIRWSETAKGRRDQIDTIKSLYPYDVLKKIVEIESTIETKKEERKPINSDVLSYSKILEETTYHEGIDSPILVNELIKQRDKILSHNNTIDKSIEAKKWYENKVEEIQKSIKNIDIELNDNIDSYNRQIDELKKKIEDAKLNASKKRTNSLKEVERIKDRIKDAETYISNNQIKETKEIDEEIKNASEINKKYNENIKYNEYKLKQNTAIVKQDEVNSEIKKLNEEKTKLLEDNNPIQELTFDSDMLYLNGVPFTKENISDSEKLMIAFKIQTMKNPKSKIFLISRGESIGLKKMEMIYKFAKDNNYQGFIEKFEFGQEELRIEEYEIIS